MTRLYRFFILEMRGIDYKAGGIGKVIKATTTKIDDFDYKGSHSAPYRDDEGYFPSLDDVTSQFGDDIYSPMAKRYYGGTATADKAIDIIQSARNNPNKMVDIYRAVPYEEKPQAIRC